MWRQSLRRRRVLDPSVIQGSSTAMTSASSASLTVRCLLTTTFRHRVRMATSPQNQHYHESQFQTYVQLSQSQQPSSLVSFYRYPNIRYTRIINGRSIQNNVHDHPTTFRATPIAGVDAQITKYTNQHRFLVTSTENDDGQVKNEASSSPSNSTADTSTEVSESDPSVQSLSSSSSSLSDIPGSKSGGKKLAIIFTCTVCGTRSAKQFTEHSYNHGVVIVQCPGCKNRHLIADNLGFFADPDELDDDQNNIGSNNIQNEKSRGWNIQKALERMGENVQVINNDNVLELCLEDVVLGKSSTKTLDDAAAAASTAVSAPTFTSEETK